MTIEMTSPACGSHDISKNGITRRVKQNYKCRDCNRQFVEDPQWKPKDKDTRSLGGLLLLEKIPLAGIARATHVSDSWLQGYANACYEAVPKAAEVVPKAQGKRTVQMVSSGRLSITKATSSGSGWQTPEKSLGATSLTVPGTQRLPYGSQSQLYIDSVPRSTPIIGRPTSTSFQANDMLLLAKKAG
jgi:hypothetical protein